eukprot:TRINITY_DN1265_c0_g1_i4.p1 TRINITY_DN1265_c0_g1~~TRINITY_DN1265_c0_g1_i4.p1  ORF type:complete len:139 (-),score=14.79 TRINITY_DN1265_c0_g1_i4:161-577(-)
MIRRPPRSTQSRSSAASDVYKRQALASFAINAQNKDGKRKDHRSEVKENFTPEQKADLKAKKMTLALNLNNPQQNKMKELFLEMDKNKPTRSENFKEMTSQQKYEAKSAMLDRRIAMQRKIKEILLSLIHISEPTRPY